VPAAVAEVPAAAEAGGADDRPNVDRIDP
jgi:hypothetical protein